MLGGLRANVWLIAAAACVFMLVDPVIVGCSQAIWQSKVALNVQGRVFAIRRMIAWSSAPLAYLFLGPLADRVFEPLLMPHGALATSLGAWIGTGAGRGSAFFLMIMGILVCLLTLGAFLYTPLRRVELDLPDAIPDTAAPVEDIQPACPDTSASGA